MRIVTADDICVAVEKILVDHLHATVQAMEWDTSTRGRLQVVAGWHHVPTLEAISSAEYPAGAIESPGLTSSLSIAEDAMERLG